MNLMKIYQKYIKYVIVALIIVIGGLFYLISRFSAKNETYALDSQKEELPSNSAAEGNSVAKENSATGENSSEVESESQNKTMLFVYVCGEIVSPGVYQCGEGSRVYELIDMAGGFTETADTTYLNLVDKVTDGQKLLIPSMGENGSSTQNQNDSKGLININTATKEQLMTLPGIGESKADDIIASRNSEGLFKSTEDIMRITGIKQSAYGKIKDLISTG